MAIIAFRVDASLSIGTGHIFRCLTLANHLRKRGIECIFICRSHIGNLIELITQNGHLALALPVSDSKKYSHHTSLNNHLEWLGTDWTVDAHDTKEILSSINIKKIDILIVDHYALDIRWEQALRPYAKKIMVIDDLADRQHDCDLLLDQNIARNEQEYINLIDKNTIKMIGPRYALLRPEFAELRGKSLERRKMKRQSKHLLISMGGVDKENITGEVLKAVKKCQFPTNMHITVVMGTISPHLEQVQIQAKDMFCPTKVLTGVSNMAELMTESDLAVGACGGTAWERCCLGLPSLIFIIAKNQLAGAKALHRAGAAIVLKNYHHLTEIISNWASPHSTEAIIKKMSDAAIAITDGQGCNRVVDILIENINA